MTHLCTLLAFCTPPEPVSHGGSSSALAGFGSSCGRLITRITTEDSQACSVPIRHMHQFEALDEGCQYPGNS